MYIHESMIEADLKVASYVVNHIENPADIWSCEKALYSALCSLVKDVGDDDLITNDVILTKISYYAPTLEGIVVELLEVPVATLREQVDYLKNYMHKEA